MNARVKAVSLTAIATLILTLMGCGSQNSSSESQVELPDYRVVDTVDQMTGGRYGEVIIPSLSADVDTTRMRRIAFGIIERENLDEAAFYNSEDALKADLSSSFREANPGTLEEGALGSVTGDDFTPTPYVHDERFQ